jgi:hypothetical protein
MYEIKTISHLLLGYVKHVYARVLQTRITSTLIIAIAIDPNYTDDDNIHKIIVFTFMRVCVLQPLGLGYFTI